MTTEFIRFGRRIRALRVAAGMSQAKLAESADISLKYLGEIERGRANPTLVNIAALARALGLRLTEIFDYCSDNSDMGGVSSTHDDIMRLLNKAAEEDQKRYYRILKALVL